MKSSSYEADLLEKLQEKLVGQDESLRKIVPYLTIFKAGLSAPNRPAGVFMLLGPTGVGKTRTVEALADVLHGSEKNLLRVDCAEYAMPHEVCKLTGAPPGYLGHRETQPVLTQGRLGSLTSERSNLSLVLFDEIEKADKAFHRILLGIFDRGLMQTGDNNRVDFSRSLIFMTSNVGAEEIAKSLRPPVGFPGSGGSIRSAGIAALRKTFSPEFMNRIDEVIPYRALERGDVEGILDRELKAVEARLGNRVELTAEAREFVLNLGFSPEYGARELKRVLQRHVVQPLASGLVAGTVPGKVKFAVQGKGLGLAVTA